MPFTRFVAIGDSQTEGLWDGDDTVGLAGWADRLAERLARDNPDLLYANLAVRARRTREVWDEQLEPTLEMRPDLVGICVGMNDVMALTVDMTDALDLMDEMYGRLVDVGATVVTTTFPDIRKIFRAARFIGPRVDRLNDRIRQCADKYDLRLVDLHAAPAMIDLRMWAPDRVHGSELGHRRFAAAAAEALGLDGADHSWTTPLPPAVTPLPNQVKQELVWAAAVLSPWIWRRIRGISSGTGRYGKRPNLAPVIARESVS